MIPKKHQKLRWAAWISLALLLLLKASFPHNTTLLYRLLQQIGIPTRIDSFHVDGILLLLLFICVLVLFLKEYGAGKTIVTLWIAVPVATYLLLGGFQSFIANGVYALDYEKKRSSCHYQSDSDGLIKGSCQFRIKNYGGQEVHFSIDMPFHLFDDNTTEPEPLRAEYVIQPHAEEIFEMPFQIRLAQTNQTDESERIVSGSITNPEIMVQAEGHERKL
ncbi:hypothetical protein ABE137_07805 [Brevibacillus laterosporus]|uniref:DUF2393 domain-containing protein n=1 Tax=Brevibacillus halotolerans TaxID=1507437 RepID=A0ABT4HRR2_9BACL|nr:MULTISPECIES: hypothetical protein [Brevibacillus]MCR8983764.1 hypothetical protein [Brevibacillus laterosporus]MCZ0829483.1 hypothetical protein [Brevibacillus halotolerans]GIO00816.1 hypothetical protein J5TS2_14840 [Brevibacillus halotolerans]